MKLKAKDSESSIKLLSTELNRIHKQIDSLVTGVKGGVSLGDKSYTHNQETASAVWEVTHNLGKHPAVTVVDSAGTEVIGEVDYTSSNTCVLRFQAPFNGKAFFN